ncbi:conserved hypothetical protein [Streptomyces viridochromogenes DSM 40736]|uniref:Uncharacterized protein n=1 Tax=Streptomyces viridochromogenes (strain DSM 40736 / JCM 4977 / BCRC 1201 / Tue 494) TaxID=591159 RepID=D9XFU4_STRVT|nr:conserved hypothetical protein [Streptomyces viridochromogenes DSM 40736]
MSDTGPVKSEDTPFEGGPMDGRVLPVLLGITGHPPKTYRIPVPDPDGGPPTVLVYRRVPREEGRVRMTQRWKYEYAPEGVPPRRLNWPWSKPDATPPGKPDDADG